ncbi:MAG: sigma-70 family RNA polymerase sigma factor [Nitriliruptorales bacterium]|nr:sigma-70 family RNA polymerase sigma factor [Nitriliruptorales bacterium]
MPAIRPMTAPPWLPLACRAEREPTDERVSPSRPSTDPRPHGDGVRPTADGTGQPTAPPSLPFRRLSPRTIHALRASPVGWFNRLRIGAGDRMRRRTAVIGSAVDGRPVPDRQSALVVRAAAGDEHAVNELYDLYAGTLYGFGLRRLGDAELAEELVQRVMTRLWQLADRYDESRASVRTWVFTIARTTLIDLRRRNDLVPPVAEPAEHPEEDDEFDKLVRAEAVRAALERLSPQHREVLDLAYFRALTQQEIARALGLPLGTVKSRTYYALKALRLACDELGVTR